MSGTQIYNTITIINSTNNKCSSFQFGIQSKLEFIQFNGFLQCLTQQPSNGSTSVYSTLSYKENGNWTNLNHFQKSASIAVCHRVFFDTKKRQIPDAAASLKADSSGTRHVSTHEAFSGASECLVNPSAKPSPSTSVGLLPHMGHSLLRSCEALIQMMRFQRWPEEMGRAPCMCWPRWRRPSVTLCSTSEHSVSLKGTCRGNKTSAFRRDLALLGSEIVLRSHFSRHKDVIWNNSNIISKILFTVVLLMFYYCY